jgi:hypothetical protein
MERKRNKGRTELGTAKKRRGIGKWKEGKE